MALFTEPFVNDAPEPSPITAEQSKFLDILAAALAIGVFLGALTLAANAGELD